MSASPEKDALSSHENSKSEEVLSASQCSNQSNSGNQAGASRNAFRHFEFAAKLRVATKPEAGTNPVFLIGPHRVFSLVLISGSNEEPREVEQP